MKPSYNIQLYEVTETEFNTSEIVLKKNQLIRFGNSHKLGDGSTKIKDIPVWGGGSPDSEGLQWSDTSMLPSAGKVPVFSTQGLLSTGMPEFPENAVPLFYIDMINKKYDYIIPITDNYTITYNDAGNKALNIVGNIKITIPEDSITFAIGSKIKIINSTIYPIEILQGGEVTPIIISNGDMRYIADKASVNLIYLGSDTWHIEGELTTS